MTVWHLPDRLPDNEDRVMTTVSSHGWPLCDHMNDHCVMTTVSQPINHCTVWRTLMITVSWPLCDTHSRDYFALNYRNTYDISRKWQTTKDRQQKIQSYETVQLTRNPKKTIRFINVRKFFHFFGSFRRTRLCSNVSATPIGQTGLKMGWFPLGNGVFNHEKGAICQFHLAAQKK